MNKIKTLVITGGNKGIGLSISKYFLTNGYFVIVGGRSSIDSKLLKNKKLRFFKMDATSETAHINLVKNAIKLTGKIDVFINNVGYSEWRPIEKINLDFLNNIIQTNLVSYFWGCKTAINYMKKGGSIINISSIAGKRGSKNNSAYSATKFAINGLTQSLSKEVGKKNIRVNAVCPVLIKTNGLSLALKSKYSPAKNKINEFFKSFAKTQSALNRLPTSEEVSQLCFYLASDFSSAITGQCINIDCGVFPQ
ncbi:SDR family oxidoreductase [Alphaproteobacteria bacterium]|nr:SDR family oxidoreductase [Alphaproteobacteria bacterium]